MAVSFCYLYRSPHARPQLDPPLGLDQLQGPKKGVGFPKGPSTLGHPIYCLGGSGQALEYVAAAKLQQLRRPEAIRQDSDGAEPDYGGKANGNGAHFVGAVDERESATWHGEPASGVAAEICRWEVGSEGSGHSGEYGWANGVGAGGLPGGRLGASPRRRDTCGVRGASGLGRTSAGAVNGSSADGACLTLSRQHAVVLNPEVLGARSAANGWSQAGAQGLDGSEAERRAKVRGLYVPRSAGHEPSDAIQWQWRKGDRGGGQSKWKAGSYPVRVRQCAQLVNMLPLGCKLTDALIGWEDRLSVLEMNAVLKQIRSWQRAAEFVDWIGEVAAPDVYSYTILIRGLVRARQWRAIDRLVAEIEREGRVVLDNVAFCTVIAGAGKAGEVEEALRWFQRMQERGCVPDTVTFNAVINAYGRAGRLKEAMAVLESMAGAGLEPDRVTFSTLLSAFGSAGMRDEAVSMFERMQGAGQGVDLVAYGSMLDLYAKAGELDEALKLLRQMQAGGVSPDAACWNCLFHGMGKAGRVDEAYALFAEMREAGCAPDQVTYSTLIWMCSTAGMIDRALAVFRLMEGEGFCPDEYCYTALLNHYASARQWQRAAAVFQELKQKGCPFGEVTYSAMINVFSKAGRLAEAEATFTEMKLAGHPPNTVVYSCMIDMCGKARSLERAVALFREMLGAGCTPNAVTYNTLIDVFGKNGRMAQAEAAFQEMRLAGLQPDRVTYSAMINGRGQAELYPEAIQLFEEMRAARCQPDKVLYGTMIKVYARAGLYKDSIRLFEEMQRGSVPADGVMYTCMLEIYWKAGRKEEARALWEAMQRLGISLVGRRQVASGIRAADRPKKRRQKKTAKRRAVTPGASDAVGETGGSQGEPGAEEEEERVLVDGRSRVQAGRSQEGGEGGAAQCGAHRETSAAVLAAEGADHEAESKPGPLTGVSRSGEGASVGWEEDPTLAEERVQSRVLAGEEGVVQLRGVSGEGRASVRETGAPTGAFAESAGGWGRQLEGTWTGPDEPETRPHKDRDEGERHREAPAGCVDAVDGADSAGGQESKPRLRAFRVFGRASSADVHAEAVSGGRGAVEIATCGSGQLDGECPSGSSVAEEDEQARCQVADTEHRVEAASDGVRGGEGPELRGSEPLGAAGAPQWGRSSGRLIGRGSTAKP